MAAKSKIEIWRKISDFPEYQISNWGRLKLKTVFADDTSKRVRGIRRDGCRRDGCRKKASKISRLSRNACLRKNGKNYWVKVSHLVLLAFVGPPPKGKYLARHLDDIPSHNWVENLSWGDHQDNYDDGVRNGRHGPNTPGAAIRGDKLRGKIKPDWVKAKISRTKQKFPERQFYGSKRGVDGRFIP